MAPNLQTLAPRRDVIVEGDLAPNHIDAQTRGFLFADLRGYTNYLESHGAVAAADLLARYRAIVRAAIAEHRGAGVRTEGDSFYVVLPSASAAVRCALSIRDQVGDENGRHPAEAIHVGIGVHAGEAIDTPEGLVGTAVNIAARLSALARPGEVLVSDTVRGLTRSVLPVVYVPRGRHRLKGVSESQEVFAVVSEGDTRGRTEARLRPVGAGVGIVAVGAVVLALAYVAVPMLTGRPASPSLPSATSTPPAVAQSSPTSSSSSRVSSSPTASGTSGPAIIHVNPSLGPLLGGYTALAPGVYSFNSFTPVLEFEVDPSWHDRAWYPLLAGSDMAALFAGRPGVDTAFNPFTDVERGMIILDLVRLQTVIGNPCDPGDTTSYQVLGGRPRDVVDWLSKQQFLEASNRQPVVVAGWTGLSVDVTVVGDPGKACSGSTVPGQGSVNLFKTALKTVGFTGLFKIHDGDQDRFVILDIGQDTPLVFIAECAPIDCPALLPWTQELIDTMKGVDSAP